MITTAREKVVTTTAEEVEVKERPIIFSGPMVKAIFEGRKTQTRRVIKPQPSESWMRSAVTDWSQYYKRNRWGKLEKYLWICHPTENREIVCPYGKPGDRLWVRETWQAYEPSQQRLGGKGPLASAMMRIFAYPPVEGESIIEYKVDKPDSSIGWRSSLHLPRWASRITLEITNIRVQRLQEISEADAIAEGVRQLRDGSGTYAGREGPGNLVTPWLTAREAFADGWDSINARRGYSWESNPFVWVVSFRKL